MTRWVAVPQRVNNPRVSFVVPMTPEAARAQLMYMQNVNRPYVQEPAVQPALLENAIYRAEEAAEELKKEVKDNYVMGGSLTYVIIAMIIIMMLMFM